MAIIGKLRIISSLSSNAYLNVSLRVLAVLALAEKKGEITIRDAGGLYRVNRRGRKATALVAHMARDGFLARGKERGVYTLTEKGAEALMVARYILSPREDGALVENGTTGAS